MNAVLHPVAFVRRRFQSWLHARLPLRDSTTLTQRNVYILPTGPGFMLGITLLVLLVASINYQLNLGYVLTFLLAGSAVVGMHVCHATLRGLTMHLIAPEPTFSGASVAIGITLSSTRRSVRHGIGLAVLGTEHWSLTDVPAQGSARVQVAFTPTQRGRQPLPALTAETRFPLGTFRVWTVWRPAARVVVYPKPEPHPPPLPPGQAQTAGGTVRARHLGSGEYDGVRAYRRGDPLKQVVWKKVAKADELVSRDSEAMQRLELWLDLAQTGIAGAQLPGAAQEQALSRLCAWVLLADQRELRFGLRLGAQTLAPASGEAHLRACLQALALYQVEAS